MMDLIERLEHGETYVDAVDDAISEILLLRRQVEELKKVVKMYMNGTDPDDLG